MYEVEHRQNRIQMLSYSTVEPDTLELLKQLMKKPQLKGMRLVGGTALALQYGHRMSIDLDFFGKLETEDTEELHNIIKDTGEIKVIKKSKNINIFLINGIKVDFVNYSYPWIDKCITENGLRLASPKDIAAMKINAIEGRGTRKDFIDIYFILKHYTLEDVISFYTNKYPEHSIFRALMSLSYFEDAEKQIPPRMFKDVSWEEIKDYIYKEVRKYTE